MKYHAAVPMPAFRFEFLFSLSGMFVKLLILRRNSTKE
jgi:hypothetical protein